MDTTTKLKVGFAALMILSGIGVASYPVISNAVAQRHASEAIQNYDDTVKSMDTEKLDAAKEAARRYNQQLDSAVERDAAGEAEDTGTSYVDLVDVEAFTGDTYVEKVVKTSHECGVKVIASNHDFRKTPPKEELITRMRKMQELGADIPKIAVMPQSTEDLLTLLSATEEMRRCYADRPVITMSMAGTGVLSRMCGEVFGSALTFGAAGKVSAPGQIDVEELRTVLGIIHKSL